MLWSLHETNCSFFIAANLKKQVSCLNFSLICIESRIFGHCSWWLPDNAFNFENGIVILYTDYKLQCDLTYVLTNHYSNHPQSLRGTKTLTFPTSTFVKSFRLQYCIISQIDTFISYIIKTAISPKFAVTKRTRYQFRFQYDRNQLLLNLKTKSSE